MTALGIALIVCGLTLVCASVIFLLIAGREPSSQQESFEESQERSDHDVREAQRAPLDLDDKSERTEHAPDSLEPHDEQHARRPGRRATSLDGASRSRRRVRAACAIEARILARCEPLDSFSAVAGVPGHPSGQRRTSGPR